MKRVVFCDFDGTITVEETFVAVLKKFAPQISAQLLPEIYAQRVSLREGVPKMLGSIPSLRYPEILEFTQLQPIRQDFVQLLDFLEFQGVPLVVVSGGLRGMVEVVLDTLVNRIHAIHAVDVDTSEPYIKVRSEYQGGSELVAKAQVMAKYPAEQKIAIGDSITDLNMALQASIVFARPPLTKYLDEQHKTYIPWNNFSDVRDYLVQLWKQA
ncbi:HAD-IB family phosphatase [Fortiea contorta]|uniref:HAD-IB family phosphatase n=1 Tax=Fortiea contorta TaxID=1892405 RepID=UPI0003473B31|nr:HAD-IB family phosphatase [Fortiea contorta]